MKSPTTDTPRNLFLEVLRFELSKRMEKNPRYSLRSFASQMGVSHALLSLVLNEKRSATPRFIEKVSQRLGYGPDKMALMVENSRKKWSSPTKESNYNKISLDEFAMISEWQHYAILSLLEIPDTQFTSKFIAERLGISPVLAKVSMQRLVTLGVVVKDASGQWRQKSGPIVVENKVSTEWTRKFQRQLLTKAIESTNNDPIAVRDMSSCTFAMDPKHVPYALTQIREFRRRLMKELENLGNPREVYNLTVQIFPTSKRRKK